MRFLLGLLAFTPLFVVASASAQGAPPAPVTYTVSGAGDELSGSVEMFNGSVIGGSLTSTFAGSTFDFDSTTPTLNDSYLPAFAPEPYGTTVFYDSSDDELFLNVLDIAQPDGSYLLCSDANSCSGPMPVFDSPETPTDPETHVVQYGSGNTYDLSAGELDPPVAATPEPSSLALLGTGILSVAGIARRRFRRA